LKAAQQRRRQLATANQFHPVAIYQYLLQPFSSWLWFANGTAFIRNHKSQTDTNTVAKTYKWY
jgi:hypothetical protein